MELQTQIFGIDLKDFMAGFCITMAIFSIIFGLVGNRIFIFTYTSGQIVYTIWALMFNQPFYLLVISWVLYFILLYVFVRKSGKLYD